MLFRHWRILPVVVDTGGVLPEPNARAVDYLDWCRLFSVTNKFGHIILGFQPFLPCAFHQVDLSVKEAYCIGVGFGLWLRKAGGLLYVTQHVVECGVRAFLLYHQVPKYVDLGNTPE